MGAVYEAEQLSLRRRVALKVLSRHLSFSDDAVKKFRREAEAGGRQKHPGIVAVYSIGQDKGAHYIAQELVEGGYTLAKKLEEQRKSGDPPVGYFRGVARLVADIADALQNAHSRGVIHRDIKPTNILLTEDGFPKVTDFGLAKVQDALALTRTGEFAGTPYYMSPEQAESRGTSIDHRTDIFSLGVTLYEMLTLMRPFEGGTTQEVLKKILNMDPRDPHEVNPRVPSDLSVICLKAIEKKPEDRYSTMADLFADLHRFLAGEPILAKPAGAVSKIWKRVKKNPALSAAVGVAIVAMLVLLLMVPWIIAQKEKEEIERRNSTGMRLLNESSNVLSENPGTSLLLAIEGAQLIPGPLANGILLESLSACHEHRTLYIGSSKSAVFSPDGKKIAIASEDGIARIWDANEYKELFTLRGHTLAINSVAFSPDGEKVITSSDDMTATIWDVKTGEEICKLKHMGEIYSAVFSPNGSKVVTASFDMTACIWDVETGEKLTILKGHNWAIRTAVFSPDGSMVLTGSEEKTARIWDSTTGEVHYEFMHESPVISAAFSLDGNKVVTGLEDGTAQVWDLGSGTVLAIFKHEDSVNSVSFSPDGQKVVTASKDMTARVWDVDTAGKLFSLKRHIKSNKSSRSPSGGKGVTTSEEKVERILDQSFQMGIITLKGHEESIRSAAFNPDGQKVATASMDGTVRIWNIRKPWEEFAVLKEEEEKCRDLKLSPDGGKTMVISNERVRIWDVETKKAVVILVQDEDIKCASFSPDAKKVAAASITSNFQIWNVFTGGQLDSFKNERSINFIAFSHDNKRLALAFDNNTACIWDMERREQIQTLKAHSGEVNSVSFSPNDGRVVTASDDQTAIIWNANTGKVLVVLDGHKKGVKEAVFSPDGKKVATASEDNTVRIWEALTGGIIASLEGHKAPINSVAFSPCGRNVVTASDDRTARIWNFDTKEEILVLRHDSPVRCAVFSADSKRVVTLTKKGGVRTWPTDPLNTALEKKPREFTFDEKIAYGISGAGARRGENASELNDESWRAVRVPFSDPESYAKAREIAREAHRLDPANFTFLKTLGVAHYRVGEYENALEALVLANEKKVPDSEGGYIAHFAFLAMAHHELGHERRAKEMLERFRFFMQDPWEGRFAAYKGFLHEAEELIASAAAEKRGTMQWEKPLNKESVVPLFFVARKKKEGQADLIEYEYALMRWQPSGRIKPRKVAGFDFGVGEISGLSISYDGRWLCFLKRNENNKMSIMALDVETDDILTVCNTGLSDVGAPALHRDGKIYFSIGEKVPGGTIDNIYWIEPHGGRIEKPRKILGRPNQVFSQPIISPDGRLMCFIHYAGYNQNFAGEVWIAKMSEDGTSIIEPKQLTIDCFSHTLCRFSSDGKYIYWYGHRLGGAVYIFRMNIENLQKEMVLDSERTGNNKKGDISVSEAGLIAFRTTEGKQEVIKVIDFSGNPIYTLNSKEWNEDWEAFSPCFIK